MKRPEEYKIKNNKAPRRKCYRAQGIKVLLSGHPEIRKLKRQYTPSFHGNKHWNASWLLMDFLKKKGLPERMSVMELGCGWGLSGIFCAKRYQARVTGVDIDSDVFPFMDLHAKINGVTVNHLQKTFGAVTIKELKDVDLLIGADICFWDESILPLKRIINRALKNGIKMVTITDPGRSPFEVLGRYYESRKLGVLSDWEARKPRPIRGRILTIGSFIE